MKIVGADAAVACSAAAVLRCAYLSLDFAARLHSWCGTPAQEAGARLMWEAPVWLMGCAIACGVAKKQTAGFRKARRALALTVGAVVASFGFVLSQGFQPFYW